MFRRINMMGPQSSELPDHENLHMVLPCWHIPEDTARWDPRGIDPLALPGEVESFHFHHIVDYLPRWMVDGVVKHFCDSLAVGGEMVVEGVDLLEVCVHLEKGYLSVMDALPLLHGTDQHQPKHAVYSLQLITDSLRVNGLKIRKCRLHQMHYHVSATRE